MKRLLNGTCKEDGRNGIVLVLVPGRPPVVLTGKAQRGQSGCQYKRLGGLRRIAGHSDSHHIGTDHKPGTDIKGHAARHVIATDAVHVTATGIHGHHIVVALSHGSSLAADLRLQRGGGCDGQYLLRIARQDTKDRTASVAHIDVVDITRQVQRLDERSVLLIIEVDGAVLIHSIAELTACVNEARKVSALPLI